jgi:predicted nucleic acid-binding protein
MVRPSELERYDKVQRGWILDTNIISATIGKKPIHPGIVHLLESIDNDRFWLSVLTVGEMRKGVQSMRYESGADAATRATGKRRTLELKLTELESRFADRILSIDLAVANRWGDLLASEEYRHEKIPAIDGLIAATAAVYNLVVVSHDSVFQRMLEHVIVYDPWSFEADAS